MNIHRVTCQHIRSGQAGPYQDSFREAILTIESQGMDGYKDANAPLVPWEPHESIVKQYAKAHVGHWEDNPEWHQARLDKFEKIGPGKWRIVIREPYLD